MIKLVLMIPTLDKSRAEKQFTMLAAGLPKNEFDVHVVALTRGGPYEKTLNDANIPFTVLGKRLKFDPFAIRRLKKLIERLQPDILHTWIFAANAYGRIVAGKSDKPKVIVSERCVDSWKSGWQLWLDKRQIPRTTKLLGNSESVAQFYREKGFPADRISVIPNGVSIPQATDESKDLSLIHI